ncbi:MAG: DNA recombination protein RmuC [Pseudomonadota bacterium]
MTAWQSLTAQPLFWVAAFLLGLLVTATAALVHARIKLARETTRANGLMVRLTDLMTLRGEGEERLRQQEQELRSLDAQISALKASAATERAQLTRASLLEPVAAQLAGFREGLERLHREAGEGRAALGAQVDALRLASERTAAQTLSLKAALGGDSAAKGQWGEVVLASLLEQSGLRPGEDFVLQPQLRDRTGRLRRPDVLVHLPDGRDVIIDAKAPTPDPRPEDEAPSFAGSATELVRRLRSVVKELAARRYPELEGVRALEVVLLFLPADAMLSRALACEPRLQQEALASGVALVTPQTLLLVLHLVHRLWQRDRLFDDAQALARQASALETLLQHADVQLQRHCQLLVEAERSGRALRTSLNEGPGSLSAAAQALAGAGVRGQKTA